MQANITITLIQDIPTFDGQHSSDLEDWFKDIEITIDILTRSHTGLDEAKICGLMCTLIHGALYAGKPKDTRISKSNNFPDKAMSTVLLQYLYIYKNIPFQQYYSRHFHLPPHYENNTIMMNVSLGSSIWTQDSGYNNISTITGAYPTCRNWLVYLRFQSCKHTL